MTKRLNKILTGIDIISIHGSQETAIDNICFDSRKAETGSLFVAFKGTVSDGHEFIDDTISKGAVAIICEQLPKKVKKGIAYVRVNDSHMALGLAASNFYDKPTENLKLVGVTGTNGKTSIVTLLYGLFTALGYKCGLLSTIKNMVSLYRIPYS
jgi:UDP-N-acetylmuramoyl-L-alanyl-D-glutamate--2,6-diaminopimelate ligase